MSYDKSISNQEEIDLLELLILVWDKKLKVAIITLMFGFLGIVYAFFIAEQEWVSQARLEIPSTKEMSEYLDIDQSIDSILSTPRNIYRDASIEINSNINNANQKTAEEIQYQVSISMFKRFTNATSSYDNKLSFAEKSPLVEKQPDNTLSSDVLLTFIDSISNEHSSKDKLTIPEDLVISLVAEEAQVAQQVLTQYIEYTNEKVSRGLLGDLRTKIKAKIKSENIKRESIKSAADTVIKVRMKNLKKSLLIAENAGIQEYLNDSNGSRVPNIFGKEIGIQLEDSRLSENSFLFMLGTKYLKAQIDVLTKSEVVYPESYYQTDLKIKLLTRLYDQVESKEKMRFDNFRYISKPSLPLKRSAPKRSIVVAIFLMLGLTLSSMWVLFESAVDSRKEKRQQS